MGEMGPALVREVARQIRGCQIPKLAVDILIGWANGLYITWHMTPQMRQLHLKIRAHNSPKRLDCLPLGLMVRGKLQS